MTEIATCPERTIDPGPCEPYINEFCIHCGGETIMPKNAEQYAAQAWAWVTLGNIAVPGAVAAVKALTPFFASAMAEARGAVPGDVAEVLEAIAAWRALTPEERNTALDAHARAARETMERGGTGAYGTRAVRLLSALAKPDGTP